MSDTLRLALVTDVFADDPEGARLSEAVGEVVAGGAGLVVLPELPLNPWSPASRTPRDDDEEPPEGWRWRRLSETAARHGVPILGGAIVRHADTGERHNTALLFGANGALLASYRKVHLPQEEGFWEADHYEPGVEPPDVARVAGWSVGLQICSDLNRPFGCQFLAAQGADVILAPRATPESTYDRWRLVLRAQAVMAGTYLVSVNRPGPEAGVEIGAATLAIAPDGTVLVETTDPLAFVDLERSAVVGASEEYPGYLARPASLYADGWGELADDSV